MSIYTLLHVQSSAQGKPTDSKLAHELMAYMTWDREVIAPDTRDVPELPDHLGAPADILVELSTLPQQTYYLQIERYLDARHSEFLSGAWLMFDLHQDTNTKSALLLLDLLVDGKPNREVLFEFTIDANYINSIDRFIGAMTFTLNWPDDEVHAQKKISERESLLRAVGVLNFFHHALIVKSDALRLARLMSRHDVRSGVMITDLTSSTLAGSTLSIHTQ